MTVSMGLPATCFTVRVEARDALPDQGALCQHMQVEPWISPEDQYRTCHALSG